MRKDWSHLDKYREKNGFYKTVNGDNEKGFFYINLKSSMLTVMAVKANGEELDQGWDHVSVSLKNRCPNWDEMQYIKELFWEPEEIAVQFHPAESEYVNVYPYCLHLWSHPDLVKLGTPPKWMVG